MKISLRSRSSGKLSTGLISALFILALSFSILMLSAAGADAAYSPLHISRGLPGATSTGLPALLVNPAGVHVDNPGQFSVEFDMGGGFSNSYFTQDRINDVLDDENFSEIADDLGDDGLKAHAGGSGSFKFRAGPIGDFDGSVTGFAGADADFSGELGAGVFEFMDDAEEILEDADDIEDDDFFEEMEDVSLNMEGTEIGGAAYGGGGISLAYDITDGADVEADRLTIGSTLHYRQGEIGHLTADGNMGFTELEITEEELAEELQNDFNNGEIDFENDSYSTLTPEGTISFVGEHSDGNTASGIGLDIGIYGEFNDRFSAGLSVENLAGSLNADSGYFVEGEVDIDVEELKDDVIDRAEKYLEDQDKDIDDPEAALEDAFVDVIDNKIDEAYEEGDIDDVSYSLPLRIRAEGAVEATENIDAAAGITYANHDIGPNDVQLAAGMEMSHLSPLKLRGGLNYSTRRESLAISSGLGLEWGVFRANLAFTDLRALAGSANNYEAGMNMGFEF